jgi:magnesium-transporting ATPase (P-type)
MKTDIKYYTCDKVSLFEHLKTDQNGLNNKEVEHRLAKYGPNTFSDKNKNTLAKIVFLQFLSPLIFILIFAGLVTLYLNYRNSCYILSSANKCHI